MGQRPVAAASFVRVRRLVLGGAATLLLALAPVRAAVEIGAAETVVRNVYGNSLNRPMEPGQRLEFNQRVRTGRDSATRLVLLDDTNLMLGERTEVTLDEFVYDPDRNSTDGRFNLVRGMLRFASAGATIKLEIDTPTATIGIRGTVFDLRATATGTEVAVLKGTVEVASAFGNRRVEAGQVLKVERGEGVTLGTTVSEEFRAASDGMARLLGKAFASVFSAGSDAPPNLAAAIRGVAPENLLFMDLATGRVAIEMRPDLAPRHVARIKQLVRQGFYDGLAFHTVRDGFVAQTGDPTGTGRGGSGRVLAAEFSGAAFERGCVGMVRRPSDPDSADSQFFICLAPQPQLVGKYTYWGRVIYGMALIDSLAHGSPPPIPSRILRLSLATDGIG